MMQNNNSDVPARLKMFVKSDSSYGPGTAYDGYSNYSKDA